MSPLAVGMRRIERWIRWTAPVWPWVKLNTDGAKKSTGIAGAGGLIRDYRVFGRQVTVLI